MNHYEILGVGPNATDQQIKEAYRREAMKWHPDRHDGAAAKGEADRRFKDLALAYRTLRSPVDRTNYDRQLEQKLRQEYEARQQEQARQQREQREQAQQKQTRQAPPQPDFVDTGPQFEEQTASKDDANQMFYEQMLDLAVELAGRGFPEFNIFKALVALGCPKALAKAVAAATAAKRGNEPSNSKTGALQGATAGNRSVPDPPSSTSPPTPQDDLSASISVEKIGVFRRTWLMLIFVLSLIMIVGVFPYQVFHEGLNWAYVLPVLLWLAAGHYAYQRLFHPVSTSTKSHPAKSKLRTLKGEVLWGSAWGLGAGVGSFFLFALALSGKATSQMVFDSVSFLFFAISGAVMGATFIRR